MRYNGRMKKKLNNNFEIYNYLNLTNRKLGKTYRLTGAHCLPQDFDVTAKVFEERIVLNEMANLDIFPPFVNEGKKEIKKRLKNSIKNIKKFKKYEKNADFLQKFSENFTKKLSLYLDLRHELSHALLKDFGSLDCDEVEIYRQLFNLDPIFGEYFDSLFDPKPNFDALLENLEEKYQKTYAEKLKALEERSKKRKKKIAENQIENEALKHAQNERKKSRSLEENKAKKLDKEAKNVKKVQNQKDAARVRAERKQNMSKEK